ncbi:MAG: NAD(P)H-binding protein [Gammaproteobacteria bacterium]|jgi:putative NADH-flavin reductase
MKIAILGASGKTGTALIEQALASGHEVIGIARTPEKIASNDVRVTKRKGDAYDEQSVIAALEGADAVITTVGKTDLKDKRINLSTAAHRAVVAGMRKHGIRPLLVISSIGAAQGVKRKGIVRNVYLFLRRKYYGDMYQMEKEIMSSGLDVTALRAPILVDEPVNGKYRVIENEDYLERLQISRTDLAKFLIGELENRRWNNRVIAIADDV